MMGEVGNVQALVIAASVAALGLAVGVAGRFAVGRVAARARTNRWVWDDLAGRLLHDLVLPLSLAAGVWAAVLALDMGVAERELIGRAVVAALILVATVAIARLVGGLVSSATTARAGVAQSATIFVTIAKIVVLAIGFLILLQSVGISITPLLTALGVGGLAVALALQDTLANLFAGVHILASKKVQQGDYVCLDSGEDGYIIDINWRNTTIQQILGNVVIVPNAKFADAIVTNCHRPAQDMTVLVEVGVSYDSDLGHVERVTAEVATEVMLEVEGAVSDYEPFIRYHAFGESSIDLKVFLRTHEYVDQYLVVHEFIKRLHERYRREGIEIPFPMRNVVMRGATVAPPAPGLVEGLDATPHVLG